MCECVHACVSVFLTVGQTLETLCSCVCCSNLCHFHELLVLQYIKGMEIMTVILSDLICCHQCRSKELMQNNNGQL